MREELENGMELAQSIHQAALDTGFDNCGILALDDMESFADRVTERMDAVPDSRAFYEGIRRNADIRKRFPWAKSLVICTARYGKYRYPEQLRGRYAKSFFLSPESGTAQDSQQTLGQWLDEKRIRWARGPVYGLRHAALHVGLGLIRKNNFFYDETGSWLNMEGFLIDRECRLYQKHSLRPCPQKCNLCVKNWPTGSLSAPYVMDPGRCISFCTTFGRGAVPEGIPESAFGEWLIGCDRCQDVCPFNRHDWDTGEVFPGLEEILPLLEPEALAAATDAELIERVIPKTANHIQPEEVATIRRSASRLLQNRKSH